MCSQQIDILKSQLKSAMKHKMINEKLENQLRSIDRNLLEEISGLRNEINLLTEQLEDLTKNISEMKYHIVNIKVCNVSEQCKMKLQLENLEQHSNGFKNLFRQEKNALLYRQDELKAKETHIEQLRKRQMEIKEIENKKFLNVNSECECLESECNVLKKRNKAIMLKLRRKLLETDEIRRNLMRNRNLQIP